MPDERAPDSGGGFLPPEPPGPEPDLGAPAPPPPAPPPPAQQWAPPPQAGWQQPPPQQPPPGWQQPPPAWAYQPQPHVPDNGPAVAGFVLSIVAGTLLLLSAGISSVVSIICAGLGIFYSRRGRRRVDEGMTPKHRGLAQAGFIVGIVSLVLAVLATVFWAAFAVLYATDEGFRDALDDESSSGFLIHLRLAATLARIGWSLIT